MPATHCVCRLVTSYCERSRRHGVTHRCLVSGNLGQLEDGCHVRDWRFDLMRDHWSVRPHQDIAIPESCTFEGEGSAGTGLECHFHPGGTQEAVSNVLTARDADRKVVSSLTLRNVISNHSHSNLIPRELRPPSRRRVRSTMTRSQVPVPRAKDIIKRSTRPGMAVGIEMEVTSLGAILGGLSQTLGLRSQRMENKKWLGGIPSRPPIGPLRPAGSPSAAEDERGPVKGRQAAG